MGRRKIEIDPALLYSMSAQGMTQKEISEALGISTVTLAKRMGELKSNQGLLTQYKSIQTLELTTLQAGILENITPEKIEKASLLDLTRAFKIFKSAELGLERDRTRVTGLLGYLTKIDGKD